MPGLPGEAGELGARMSALYGSAWRVDLLAGRGDLDGLRAGATTGDGDGDASRPADQTGPDEEAERLRRFGLNPDGSIATA